MSSGGKYMKFPNKDRPQLGSASPRRQPSRGLWRGGLELQGLDVTFRDTVPGETLRGSLGASAGLLPGQRPVRNSRNTRARTVQGRSQNTSKAQKDSNKEGSLRKIPDIPTFSAGEAEWKNHPCLLFGRHSEERF